MPNKMTFRTYVGLVDKSFPDPVGVVCIPSICPALFLDARYSDWTIIIPLLKGHFKVMALDQYGNYVLQKTIDN